VIEENAGNKLNKNQEKFGVIRNKLNYVLDKNVDLQNIKTIRYSTE